MERLILYYNPFSPSQIHPKRCPPPLRLRRFDVPNFGIPASQPTTTRRVVTSFLGKHEESSPAPSHSVTTRVIFPDAHLPKPASQSPLLVDFPNGSGPNPHFVKQIVDSCREKAVAAGRVILLLTLITALINPITVSPAFASLQKAAATTGAGRLLRTELLTSAWTGLVAGCLHTLSGPDHLAALAPLSIGLTQIQSAAAGALWGCGHDAGQVIFGLLFLLLKDRLHMQFFHTWGARVVGLALLVIGGMGIREAMEVQDCEIGDAHAREIQENLMNTKKTFRLATFITGIVHGLQPDAMVIVLPALSMPSRMAGASFLGMFLLGTIIAMGSYAAFLSSCTEALKGKVPKISEKLTWVSSLIAIALGLAMILSHFFGFSLF